MKVHVWRTAKMWVADASWTALSDDELVLFVPRVGVTGPGALALEHIYAAFIDSGEWRYKRRGGHAISAHYHLGILPRETRVRVDVEGVGNYIVTLSRRDFTTQACRGIQRCVNESIEQGWRAYPPPADVRALASEVRRAS